jgi:hypothetical protein
MPTPRRRVPAHLLLVALALVATSLAATPGPQQEPDPALEALLEQARPGPEHERLAVLAGDWEVQLRQFGAEQPLATGAAEGASILEGRFVDVSGELEGHGAFRFTLGFDRRHGEFTITLADTNGTYAVSARGEEQQDGRIRMRGRDDDPYMQSLGLEKEFVFDLVLEGEDAFRIELFFVDTRTEERPLLEQVVYAFARR